MDSDSAIRRDVPVDPAAGTPVPRVVAITGGNRGEGRTVLTANLAVVFARSGHRVLIIDAALGSGHIDALFGLTPRYGLHDFFSGRKGIPDILTEGPEGIRILPAGSGNRAVTKLSSTQKLLFQEALDRLHEDFDLVLVDTGAGISENVAYFGVAAQAIVVVTTADLLSLTGAGALMQVLSDRYQEKDFHLVVNAVGSEGEAKDALERLILLPGCCPAASIRYLGYIPYEPLMPEAIARQEAIVRLFPDALSSRAFDNLARQLGRNLTEVQAKGSVQFFWPRLLLPHR